MNLIMFFSFYSRDDEFEGELLYIQKDHSLYYEPFCTCAGISILCSGYTSFDTIHETGAVIHISGLNSKTSWVKKTLNVPIAKRGSVFAHFDKELSNGMGIDYDRYWLTYYDEEKQYICIGDDCTDERDDCVEFANNVIAVIRKGDLIAVWAKIREVETSA